MESRYDRIADSALMLSFGRPCARRTVADLCRTRTPTHLPYPYGRELMGYEVTNLAETLTKAKAAGTDVLVPPYKTEERAAVVVRFPGGYIAEIHSVTKK
jgi:hypothetical protein